MAASSKRQVKANGEVLSNVRSDSLCTTENIRASESITILDSKASPNESALRSIYHIYHKKEQHSSISSIEDPCKERWWGPTIKEQKQKRIQRKRETTCKSVATANEVQQGVASDDESDFFLHTPYLSFHDPPRVLYAGKTKRAIPVVLIHSKFLWRSYKLQFGPSIATPGVLDPRGVVCWRHNGGNKKELKRYDKKLKGYKVKTWRLWGETGKSFVHGIRAMRKAGTGPDPDLLEEDTSGSKAVHANEVVYLKWTSPFSRNTRRYHFQYGGIEFYWKGTGTVKETRTCGMWCHFNHLKLVAKLPSHAENEDEPQPEVCLGKYTSSVAAKKHGTLHLFDGAIWHFMSEHMPSLLPDDGAVIEKDKAAQVSTVKTTWFYRLLVSTAMCMVIGEKQKRDTIRKIIEELASAGGDGS